MYLDAMHSLSIEVWVLLRFLPIVIEASDKLWAQYTVEY